MSVLEQHLHVVAIDAGLVGAVEPGLGGRAGGEEQGQSTDKKSLHGKAEGNASE